MQTHRPNEPIIRFDDHAADSEVDVAAQLVPLFGYEEAERIARTSARTHRPVDDIAADAA